MLPKELSETVNRSRKDNAMVKRKETNEQTTIYKSSHRKLLLQTWLYVMNEECTRLCLRQTEHTRGHLGHRYFDT